MTVGGGMLADDRTGRRASPAEPRPSWWPPVLAAALLVVAMAWQQRLDLNLADEGFLWYGAQRVLAGELPLRDFQAYDPARYFWSAAWMALIGSDGIVALRWGNTVLAALTVILAGWTVSAHSHRASASAILLAGLVFALWMVPAYKVSDSFAAILLLFAFTRLVQRPTLRRHAEAGACWGVAAMIGINHALYGAIAGLLVFLYVGGASRPVRRIGAAAAGAILGYSPILALHVLAPGFTAGFIDSISRLFEYGETNQALPFPNPFGFLQVPRMGILMAATETLGALLFALAPVLWIWGAWRLRSREARAAVQPVIPASLILSIPYAHYAYSRADPLHLAVSILPLIALMLALALQSRPAVRRPALALLFLISLVFTAHMQPGYYFLRGDLTQTVAVGPDRLRLRPETEALVRAAQAASSSAGERGFFAGPYLPGAYAVARRRSPVWEIYMLFPALPWRQKVEIERLQRAEVRQALISTQRADGRADLGLAQTHPLLMAYLRKCFASSRAVPAAESLILSGVSRPGCPPPERIPPGAPPPEGHRPGPAGPR